MKKIPNILSITRIILIPVIAWLIISDFYLYAFAVSIIIAITDFSDGLLARLLDAETELGSYLDAIADKAFIIFVYMLIGAQDLLPIFIIIIVVSRDIIILGSFALSFISGQKLEIHTILISKFNTFFQFTLIILVLFNNVYLLSDSLLLEHLISGLSIIVLITTLISLLVYIKQWINTNS